MNALVRAVLLASLAAAGAACASTEQEVDNSDAGVKARVEIALRGRKDLDASHISVDVENGTVTLSGLVTSPEQRDIVDRLVKHMSGVDTFLDNLLVQE